MDQWRNSDVIVVLYFVGGKSQLEHALSEMDLKTSPDICSRTRLRVDIQHSTRIAFWRCMGVADWNCATRIGWNVTGDWMHTANPWTMRDSRGRGYWNRQQPPHFSSTLWHPRTATINHHYTMLLMMKTRSPFSTPPWYLRATWPLCP